MSCYRITHEFSQKLHNLCTAVLDVKKRNLKTSVVTVMSLLAVTSVVTEECCDCDECFDCDECCNCDEFLTKCQLIRPPPTTTISPPPPPPPQTSVDLIRSGQFLSAFNRLAALNANTAYRRLV